MAIVKIKQRPGTLEIPNDRAKPLKRDFDDLLVPRHTPVAINNWSGTLDDIKWIELEYETRVFKAEPQPIISPEMKEKIDIEREKIIQMLKN